MVRLPFGGHHGQSRLNHFINDQAVASSLQTGFAATPLATGPSHVTPSLTRLTGIPLAVDLRHFLSASFTRFCAFNDGVTTAGLKRVAARAAIGTPAVAIATFRRILIQRFHFTATDAGLGVCTGRGICSHTYRADRYLPNRYRSGGNQADCVAFTIRPYTDHPKGCVFVMCPRLGVPPAA